MKRKASYEEKQVQENKRKRLEEERPQEKTEENSMIDLTEDTAEENKEDKQGGKENRNVISQEIILERKEQENPQGEEVAVHDEDTSRVANEIEDKTIDQESIREKEVEDEKEKVEASEELSPADLKLKLYKCKSCLNLFNMQDKIGEDNKAVHFEEKFACRFCDQRFHTSNDIQYHVYECHSPNPIQCVTCDDMFENSNQLQTHITNQHNRQQEELVMENVVICKKCGKTFQSGVDYDYHQAECRLETDTRDTSKDYTCSDCPKTFPMVTDVWMHVVLEHEKRNVNPDKLIVNLLAEQNLQLKEELSNFKNEMKEAIKFVGDKMVDFTKEV